MTDEEVHVAAAVNDVEYVNLVGDDARRGFYTCTVHPGDCTASTGNLTTMSTNQRDSSVTSRVTALADGTSLIRFQPFWVALLRGTTVTTLQSRLDQPFDKCTQ